MDVTVGLGHFCDVHGPCVVLCTERTPLVPPERALSAYNPVCSACESLDPNTIYSSEDENFHYISSRTSKNIDTTHFLRDAVLRSLSIEVVEESGRNSGTIYFGDSKRGHIISHVFNIKDSLARGFRRKYCIVILGKHQISLLNHYEFLDKNLSRISADLQQKAREVSTDEDNSFFRQNADKFSASKNMSLRSLPLLVGQPNTFAHLHMWFVFLLRASIYRVMPHDVPKCPVYLPSVGELKNLRRAMPDRVFQTVCYCILTGIRIEEVGNTNALKHFRQLLPSGFALPTSGEPCHLSETPAGWSVDFRHPLPGCPPRLLCLVADAFADEDMCDEALSCHLAGNIMHWFSVASVLSWNPTPTKEMMLKLEVQNCDMPLLSYWVPQSGRCVELFKTD